MYPTLQLRTRLILLLVILMGCNEPPVDEDAMDAIASTEDVSIVQSPDDGIDGRTDAEVVADRGSAQDGSVAQLDVAPLLDDSSIELDQAFIPTQPCERTNDCPEPQVCNENLCDESTTCQSDGDCTLGYLCNRSRNRCVIACRNQANCPLDQICTSQKCEPGTRCNSDRECEVGEMCQNDGSGGFCTEDIQAPLGDMGVSPDGGIWTCNDTECEARQRCGPHPNSSCEVTDCLSAHGGTCEANCNCLSGLICKQNTQSCVQCLNGLQCDSPEQCITTGQCGLNIDLEPEQIPELSVLQTLVQCQLNINNDACARFSWTNAIPELTRLKAMGCGDTIYASAMADQAPIQDLLRCGGPQSPIIFDPSFDPTSDTEACVTERAGYYIFHGCSADQVPLN